jgi:hypothetical protein
LNHQDTLNHQGTMRTKGAKKKLVLAPYVPR